MGTLIEKIFSRHAGKPVQAGDIVDLAIDTCAARDFGGANVVKHLTGRSLPVHNPDRIYFTFDCNPTGSDQKYAANQQLCREFARKHGIRVYDIQHGIGTHLMIDHGLVGPGDTFVSTDSHANILGAVGAFGQGMGDIDIAYAFSHGKVWFQVPPSLKIHIRGALPGSCSAKDLTLALLRYFGADGLLGCAAELYGEAIDALDLSGRMTLASMATEMAGIILLIPPSDRVIDSCRKRGAQFNPVFADPDAQYLRIEEIDISRLEPLISRPGRPDDVVPVREAEGQPVDSVFIGSCTNGRYEDLLAAAEILKNRKVAEHVVLKIVPATDAIWQQCMEDGLFALFKKAGALISNAGCAGCAAGQVGQNGPGEVTVSTGNRNFFGKQGKGSVYLASPATAAASAVAGSVISASQLGKKIIIKSRPVLSEEDSAEPLSGPPEDEFKNLPVVLRGRVRVIRRDHIDTDMIYHNRYLTVTRLEEMGQYTFQNLEGWENFAERVLPGDILITGENFGCGSSRQQAVDCFRSLGMQLIIARSFGAIYERNAINSAFPVMKADLLDAPIEDEDIITIDLSSGIVQMMDGNTIQGTPFSEIQMSIYQHGGLL